jgi:hypothetical protein
MLNRRRLTILSLKKSYARTGAGEGYFGTGNHRTFEVDGLSQFLIHPGCHSSDDPDFDRIPMDQAIPESRNMTISQDLFESIGWTSIPAVAA